MPMPCSVYVLFRMPFDEMKVWQDNFEYVRKAIGVQHLKVSYLFIA